MKRVSDPADRVECVVKRRGSEKTLYTSAPVAKMVVSLIHLFNLSDVEGSDLELNRVEYNRSDENQSKTRCVQADRKKSS